MYVSNANTDPMRVRGAALLALSGLLLVAQCSGSGHDGAASSTTSRSPGGTTTTVARATLARRLCDGSAPRRTGTISDPEITEASGVVQSRRYPGVVWVHNDSGDTPRIFAMTTKGVAIRQYAIPDAKAVDWEDIGILAGVNGGPDTLYLGDIGDNNSTRSSIHIYAIPEPDPAHDTTAGPTESERLLYPDGPHNAEAMFVDPATRDVIIVTKEPSGASRVYRKQGGLLSGHPTLTLIATLHLGLGELVTAGDISPDGSAIILRTYFSVFVWSRDLGEDIATAFTRQPCEAPSPVERQSEAISIDADGRGYLTTSEGVHAPIFHVQAG